jgi:hypothetical protein
MFACGETVKKSQIPTDGYYYEPPDDTVNFVKYFYKEGKLVSETPFVDHKAEGLYKDYYSNGNPRLTVEYKNAKREGMTVSYYETGEKHGEIPYVNGKVHGTKYFYKKDGSVTMKSVYENDKPVPPLEEYDTKGDKIPQPTIKFKSVGGVLKMELSDKSFSSVKFYAIINGKFLEIHTEKGVGSYAGAKKGTRIRAYYSTPRNAEGAVDAKY